MLLSDNDIERCLGTGDIEIDPYSGSLEPASYDLRVGCVAITEEGRLDLAELQFITIQRGSTVVVSPLESIGLSRRIAARYGLRSRFARKGLILLSGPQIDPGFQGRLSVTVFNAGPSRVVLKYREPFATIEFVQLTSRAREGYSGPYQMQETVGLDEYELVTTPYRNFAEIEELITELRTNVAAIEKIVYGLFYAIVAGLAVAVIVILVGSPS